MPHSDPKAKIIHHTALQKRGGARRVAQILRDCQQGEGIDARMSFEIPEDTAFTGTQPIDFGRRLEPDQVPHLHASADWPSLLKSIPRDTRCVITLHDCNLITGGCPFPLDCPHFAKDCEDPCPRGFPASFENRRIRRERLDRLQPTLVSPSRWLATLAREALPGHKVRIIPNGIPWPESPPDKQAARAALGLHPNARAVLFAAHGGMRAAYKSGEAWPVYWREIKRRQPGAVGFAVGGDTAGEQDGLTLWPYVDREKLGTLMDACDCFVYPTLADNHSLLILEAMSHGQPVVASPVGGVPEQIEDGTTGFLVKTDPEDFGEAVSDLLEHAAQARRVGHTAFLKGGKRFDAKRMAAQYAPLYNRQE